MTEKELLKAKIEVAITTIVVIFIAIIFMIGIKVSAVYMSQLLEWAIL
jgi:hypothetical protein